MKTFTEVFVKIEGPQTIQQIDTAILFGTANGPAQAGARYFQQVWEGIYLRLQ